MRGSSALSEHVGGLETRLSQATASTAHQETRLTTVEGIAAGLVTLEPTGMELGRLCMTFEDRCTHTYMRLRRNPALINASNPIHQSSFLSSLCVCHFSFCLCVAPMIGCCGYADTTALGKP